MNIFELLLKSIHTLAQIKLRTTKTKFLKNINHT